MNRTLISALVASAIAIASGCDNAQQRMEKYITQGDSFLEQNNAEKARISYKNALQINPQNAQARMKFAAALEQLNDMKGAYGQYLAVLEAEPNNIAALEKQGKLLLMAREADLALVNAEKMLQIKGADYVPALTLKAGVLTLQDKVSDAIALAERAAQLDADNLDNCILLGSLYTRSADFARAESVLSRAAKAHPTVIGLKIMLAESLRKQGKNDEVESILRDLAQSSPDELNYAMQLSRHLKNAGKATEALDVMQAFVAAHGDDINAKLALVQLIDVVKNADAGDAALAEFAKANPAQYRLQFAQIERQLAQGKQDAATTALEAIATREQTGNDAITARMMLARQRVTQNDIVAAKKLIDEILTLNPSDLDALALRGRIAVAEKRYADAIGDLRAVVTERLDDLASVMLLASTHVQNNEVDLADEVLQRSLKFYPSNNKLKLMLADVKNRKGERDAAIAQYRSVLEKAPNNATALLELAKLYQAGNDVKNLADVADRMLADQKTMATGFYYQGLIQQSEGKHAAALELFEKALALSPDAVEPQTAAIKGFLLQKQPAQAIRWIDARIAQKPGSATLHNLKADVLASEKKLSEAATNLRKAIALSPSWWVPYRSLSAIEQEQNDFAGAEKTLTQGLSQSEKNPMLRMELATLLDKMGRIDDAIVVYRGMLDDGINGDTVVNNLAMLLATKGDAQSLDAARGYSDRLAQSKNPLYLDTAGWVQYKRGEYQSALPILEKAAELAPKHPQIRYHLGVAYFKNNQRDRAREQLMLALKDGFNFDGRQEAEQVLRDLDNG